LSRSDLIGLSFQTDEDLGVRNSHERTRREVARCDSQGFLGSEETNKMSSHMTTRRSSYAWSKSLRRHLKRHSRIHSERRRQCRLAGAWEWRIRDDAIPPPSLYAILYRPEHETGSLLPHNPLEQLCSGWSTARHFLIWSRAQGKQDNLLGKVSIPGELTPHEAKLLVATELSLRHDFLLELEDGSKVDVNRCTISFNQVVRKGDDSLYLVKTKTNMQSGRMQTGSTRDGGKKARRAQEMSVEPSSAAIPSEEASTASNERIKLQSKLMARKIIGGS